MKKVFSLLMVCLLLVGCGVNKDIKKAYKTTKISDEMNGYQLDMRIKGNYNGKQVSEIVRITNYMDKQIKIQNSSLNTFLNQKNRKEEYILILNDKTYKITDNEYIEVGNNVPYNKPSAYLEILNKLAQGKENKIDKIGEISYKVYDIKVKKNILKKALIGTEIEDITFKNDIRGEVWINPDQYVYKVIYYLNEAIESEKTLQLMTLFSSYNMVKEMSLPDEQKTSNIENDNIREESFSKMEKDIIER